MNNDLSHKVLEKIKKEHIEPKPQWQFLLKNYFVWGVGILALLVGGLVVSVIIYLMLGNDWSVYHLLNHSLFGFIFKTLPYVWLGLLAVFIILVYYDMKHTKKGYRYSLHTIIFVSIFISIALGALLYNIGIGRSLDDILSERAPAFNKIANHQVQFWTDPESGRLAGVIIEIRNEHEFLLKDIKRVSWVIINEKANIRPLVRIENGARIKIIGKKMAGDKFRAEHILPFGPGRAMFNRFPELRPEFKERTNKSNIH